MNIINADNGGIDAHVNKVRFFNEISFETKLKELCSGDLNKKVVVCSYSLDYNLISRYLNRLTNVEILLNSKNIGWLQSKYPSIKFYERNDVHAKFMLIEPNEVLLSSQNFWNKGNLEYFQWGVDIIGDKDVYNFYSDIFENYVKNSNNIEYRNKKQAKQKYEQQKLDYTPLLKSEVYLGSNSIIVSYPQLKLFKMQNYATKFVGYRNSQNKSRNLCLVTYTMPDNNHGGKGHLESILTGLKNSGTQLTLFASADVEKVERELKALSKKYKCFRFLTCKNLHAKMIIDDNKGVFLSSQNFSDSDWFEDTIRVKNGYVHTFYLEQFINFLKSQRIYKFVDGKKHELKDSEKESLLNDLAKLDKKIRRE